VRSRIDRLAVDEEAAVPGASPATSCVQEKELADGRRDLDHVTRPGSRVNGDAAGSVRRGWATR
jgi:hypothetical protein